MLELLQCSASIFFTNFKSWKTLVAQQALKSNKQLAKATKWFYYNVEGVQLLSEDIAENGCTVYHQVSKHHTIGVYSALSFSLTGYTVKKR